MQNAITVSSSPTARSTRQQHGERVRRLSLNNYYANPFNVRFGSLADMCAAKSDVRFTPNSDSKSRHAANGHVRFTPESGHVRCNTECPLRANTGHSDNHS